MLEKNGVPSALSKLIFLFTIMISIILNNFEKKKIKIVKMEVEKKHKTKNNFLKKVRSLCSKIKSYSYLMNVQRVLGKHWVVYIKNIKSTLTFVYLGKL